MTSNMQPFPTFAPAPALELVAHFARRDGRGVERRPVVGWFIRQGMESDDGEPEPHLDVTPAVMMPNGSVFSLHDADEAGTGALIGVYLTDEDPAHVDPDQYRAVMQATRRP